MKFVNLIIDSEKIKKACFLCFELNGDNKLYDEITIHDSKLNLKTSLYNIATALLPTHEILFAQACQDCSNAMIKMFSVIQDHLLKKNILQAVVFQMIKDIPKAMKNKKKCSITLPRSKFEYDNNVTVANDKQKIINQEYDSCKEHKTKKNEIHDSSTIVICHICGKSCVNPKSLKAHFNCHSKKQCPCCNKLLKNHSHFNRHVKNHSIQQTNRRVDKMFICSRCSYHSKNKNDLEAHTNKAHFKIKPYNCQQCSKSFYKKSNLTAHEIIHFNVSPFICEICGQGFTYKKTLSEHLKLHSGEKIYKCDICNRNFTTQSRRNEHIKRNHSNKFISCTLCKKKYTLQKELNNHIKKFHNGIS